MSNSLSIGPKRRQKSPLNRLQLQCGAESFGGGGREPILELRKVEFERS